MAALIGTGIKEVDQEGHTLLQGTVSPAVSVSAWAGVARTADFQD